MKLKAGMKVVRISSYQKGPWERACTRKGLDPSGVFTVDHLSYGNPVFLCLNNGYWEGAYFKPASVETSLEDWL